MANRGAGLSQQFGLQLLGKKAIGFTLVNQQGQAFFRLGNQFASVPCLPCRTVFPR
jgi:hypothetical protein